MCQTRKKGNCEKQKNLLYKLVVVVETAYVGASVITTGT